MANTTIVTPPCYLCKEPSKIVVDQEAYLSWRDGTALIQEAFPHHTPEQRELIKTGFHPSCWTKVFGSDDDELEI